MLLCMIHASAHIGDTHQPVVVTAGSCASHQVLKHVHAPCPMLARSCICLNDSTIYSTQKAGARARITQTSSSFVSKTGSG